MVGRFGAPYGVRGEIHIQSFTDPLANLAQYTPRFWRRDEAPWQALELVGLRSHRGQFVAAVPGFDQREDLGPLKGAEIGVPQTVLPALDPGEHYWRDLVGCAVVNQEGVALGTVDSLLETGAHDVLVVRGEVERLIPFVAQYVLEVTARRIAVDWPADWDT